jgi:copper chaperone
MERKILKVEGMSCEHCVKVVTDALGQLSGVADIAIDLKEGTVSFNFDSSSDSLSAAKAAIADAGYKVTG